MAKSGKNGASKGFSLFTPLVGTVLILMTIFLSVVMVQNDVAIARGLSSAYVNSAQEITVRQVQAVMINKIRDNEAIYINDYFANPVPVFCTTAAGCVSEWERTVPPFLAQNIKEHSYTDILTALSTVPGSLVDENGQQLMFAAKTARLTPISQSNRMFSGAMSSDGGITITLDRSLFYSSLTPAEKNELYLFFNDSITGDISRISLVPEAPIANTFLPGIRSQVALAAAAFEASSATATGAVVTWTGSTMDAEFAGNIHIVFTS